MTNRLVTLLVAAAVLTGCQPAPPEPADLVLVNARVYTLSWPDPGRDGTPAAGAPRDRQGWHPDAEAVAIRGDRIVFAGAQAEADRYRGPATRVIDLEGATLVPGLIDSHTHVAELGARLTSVDLTGVATEAEAVERVAARAAQVPRGEWIVGRGWDEGAWANRYPTMALLSERVPDHPVVLFSLHGFAIWGNRLAFERAGITRATTAPTGGEIRVDARGNPTGVLLNRATPLLASAVPQPSPEQYERIVLAGLQAMADSGYVGIHEAGVDAALMQAFESLDARRLLPVRVYAMISARDGDLSRAWLQRGPKVAEGDSRLTVRAVKAYYDGALGSRGARLLDDYADMPGHRGVSGEGYGFDQALVAEMMKAGFQVGIHAIGDAGNRETLDFIAAVNADSERSRAARHRIEHAQIVAPQDLPRFAELGVTASMEPPHAVEDKAWAEARVGPERIKGGYAWRSLRQSGAHIIFNSDLTGSDHNIFYGLHSAITRRDRDLQPPGGWHPEQRFTPEEALRAYTIWAAWSAFQEADTGIIAAGRWADLTALEPDPLVTAEATPDTLLGGRVRLTVVGGRVAYEGRR
ncbi:MAG: amidohydrolase [Acidobacteriota bacterium]